MKIPKTNFKITDLRKFTRQLQQIGDGARVMFDFGRIDDDFKSPLCSMTTAMPKECEEWPDDSCEIYSKFTGFKKIMKTHKHPPFGWVEFEDGKSVVEMFTDIIEKKKGEIQLQVICDPDTPKPWVQVSWKYPNKQHFQKLNS
jgi:hypothetical protein